MAAGTIRMLSPQVTTRSACHGFRRWTSGWLGGLLGRNTSSEKEAERQEPEEAKFQDHNHVSPEEVLERIAQDHFPDVKDKASWREADLGDTHLKSKILCSFESAFACSIPNRDLPGITTFADLLKIVKTPDQQEHPTSVFPNIKDDGTLPPNLSIQFINTAPKPKPERKPFQNFDAQRPEHATFLSKAERERRKLKGRHLTAAKYKK